jgi:transposase-like protein
MRPISYARHRFPPDIIRHAVCLYLRFTLSYRDVEDLLAERGLMVSRAPSGIFACLIRCQASAARIFSRRRSAVPMS